MMRRGRILLLAVFLSLVFFSPLPAQQPQQVQAERNVTDGFSMTPELTTRKALAAGTVGTFLAGSLVSSYFDWWKGTGQRFHFTREGYFGDYSLGIDKLGHAYTSYFYFHSIRNFLLWGGYDPSAAFWWAFGGAVFFAVSIEIGDGFSPYGFSIEDLSANAVGLGWAALQTEEPFLRNFSFKWSYVPLSGYRWPPHFTNHYDGHTYWLALNVHNLLPEETRSYWPEFLQLAVGYSIKGYADSPGPLRRELVVGLDFNINAFSVENRDWHLLQRTASMIHLPAPAVKFRQEGAKGYLLHLN